jgi:hypothetical protein
MKTIQNRAIIIRSRRSSIILLLLVAATLLSLASCVREFNNFGKAGDDEALVTFTIAVPGRAPASRALLLSIEDEGRVNTVDVLLFDASISRPRPPPCRARSP